MTTTDLQDAAAWDSLDLVSASRARSCDAQVQCPWGISLESPWIMTHDPGKWPWWMLYLNAMCWCVSPSTNASVFSRDSLQMCFYTYPSTSALSDDETLWTHRSLLPRRKHSASVRGIEERLRTVHDSWGMEWLREKQHGGTLWSSKTMELLSYWGLISKGS